MKAVILAGGKGARMGGLTEDLPKPMIEIVNKPILEYQIESLKENDIVDILMLVYYKGNIIEEYFGDGSKWGVNIEYHYEKEPLGTAGAIGALKDILQEDFFVFYGDILINVDLLRLKDQHEQNKKGKDNYVGTLVVHPNTHPYDSDLVEVDGNNIINRFLNKPHSEDLFYRNLVNAALYLLSPNIFKYISENEFADFGRDVFPAITKKGEDFLFAYNTPEYLKDIGTLDRLEEAVEDITSGKYEKGSLRTDKPAIFLDRDGVINEEVDNLCDINDFKLIDGVIEAIKKINDSEFYTIIITNQPMIAKGFCSYDDINEIHKKMESELGNRGAKIDAIHVCPHHPDKGFEGENIEYKIECDCRKPNIGMIKEVAKDFNIDLKNSYFIGDSTVDALTAKNVGIKFIGVSTGYGCQDKKYINEVDVDNMQIEENLNKAIDKILQ